VGTNSRRQESSKLGDLRRAPPKLLRVGGERRADESLDVLPDGRRGRAVLFVERGHQAEDSFEATVKCCDDRPDLLLQRPGGVNGGQFGERGFPVEEAGYRPGEDAVLDAERQEDRSFGGSVFSASWREATPLPRSRISERTASTNIERRSSGESGAARRVGRESIRGREPGGSS
jgi:hypothetical protein